MRRLTLAALLCVLPSLLAAQSFAFCEELWTVRNLIFDRAGYCFGSSLGAQLFDNSDCTGTSPVLSPQDAQSVDIIRQQEARIGCAVNTTLGPSGGFWGALAEYSRLIDIPAPDELGSACWGYTGPPVRLHSGAFDGAPVIGQLQPGQSFGSGHWPRDGWSYIQTSSGPGGIALGSGWVKQFDWGGVCAEIAG